jgi:predicted nuclease of predicted toxin-antitoxin system
VRLLFDENLSPRLAALVADDFPGSLHVASVGLRGAEDAAVWEHARSGGFIVVSKDDDFRSLGLVRGAPPKVVWLRVGNAATTVIADPLRRNHATIATLDERADAALLVLWLDPHPRL